MDYKNLATRTVSGAVLVAIIIGSILWNDYSFAIIFAAISCWATHEFHTLTNREDVEIFPWAPAISSILLFIAFYCENSGCLKGYKYPSEYLESFAWVVYGLYTGGLMVNELYRKKKNPIANWANIALGQVYVALPIALLNYIIFYRGEYTPLLVLALFLLIWSNDSFAFLSGSMLGKHPLFKRISPKKSWEGFIGGNLGALAVGYGMSFFEPSLTWWQWLIFAQIVVIFGTYGDLIESLLKRTLGVKDSGKAIPGHGGWLDRFDSLLIATPMIVFYLYILF